MDNMQTEQMKELTSTLVEAAKGYDCITFALLNHLIPDEKRETAIIESVFDYLQTQNIDIIIGKNYWPDDTEIH